VSHYEQRLANDKDAIRQRIVALGRRCSDAVSASVEALLSGDHARSYRIVVDDLPINRESRSIDRACHAFVARHLPSASHLRFISAVMRMNVELERVGDYAAGIARHAVQLERPPEGKVADEMRTLVARSSEMMADALSAFEKGDAELARETKPVARAMQHSFELVFDELTADATLDLRQGARLLSVFNKLERVSDQAKNICEETLFELLGETKPPKRYRILFVDGRHSLIAPLAEMLARKAFPNSGQYESAGYQPADALADDLLSLAMDMGLDVGGIAPTDLKAKNLSKFHVVVWLNGNPGKHIDKMPYQTVLVAWDLPKLADAKDGDVRTQVREIANALSAEIRDLMVTMRGEDAD
jgi:phosphate transport system protein